jgi:tetratricopeptide (TPR) repeat protein
MARVDKRKRTKPKPKPKAQVAVASRPARGSSIEDTMFFPRLRRHTKWMFVFLALVFGLGFVIFGIGATGTGIGDVFRNSGGGSGAPSVSEARERTEKNPKDAQAWRDLSTAYQTNGETAAAVDALKRFSELRPKDGDALRELGGLYLAQGRERVQAAQLAQYRTSFAAGGSGVVPGLTTDGRPVLEDEIAQAIQQGANTEVNLLVSEAQAAYASAVETYRQLVKATPNDPNVQLELAQAAEQAGDRDTAITAYTSFLRLAPEDANAPIVKQQLKLLRSSGSSGSG